LNHYKRRRISDATTKKTRKSSREKTLRDKLSWLRIMSEDNIRWAIAGFGPFW
jgi:hypothetical protein